MAKKIRELLEAARLAGHMPTTDEEILAEKAAIEQGFVALGLTIEEGEARVCAHDYDHDGGAFDLLAERYIKNQAFLDVMCQCGKPIKCGDGWTRPCRLDKGHVSNCAERRECEEHDLRPTVNFRDESVAGPMLPGHSENHLVHWSGCTVAAPGLPRSADLAEVTCPTCRETALAAADTLA